VYLYFNKVHLAPDLDAMPGWLVFPVCFFCHQTMSKIVLISNSIWQFLNIKDSGAMLN
jgi:hypothetical protein